VHDEGSTAQALYGRERELHLLDDLIGRVNDRGAALEQLAGRGVRHALCGKGPHASLLE
jgi:hypothetical protein